MPDPRFFQTLSPLTVAALAEHIGGEVVRGGEVVISAPTTHLDARDLEGVYHHEEDDDVDGNA